MGRTAELARVELASRHVRLVVIYGVGGIGKTAFMMKAAHQLVDRVGGRLAYHDCRQGESPATLMHALVEQLDAAQAASADPFGAVLRYATSTPLVLCLDNAHRPNDPGFCEALALLASRGAPLWVIVAARETLPVSPTDIDHVVVRLGGLSPDETRALWQQLEQLYGPAPRAVDPLSSGGNPLLLKQRFTQPKLALRDQLGIDTLSEAERDLLRELSAFRKPLDGAYLESRRAALDALVHRFLVDERADGLFELHDVVREAVHASVWAPTAEHHARCYAFYGNRDELERLHHAVAAGMDDVAEQILARYADPSQRIVPPNAVTQHQVAQAIDLLMLRRSVRPAIQMLRVQIRGRMGDAVTAYKQIQALRGPDQPMAEVEHAELALALGHVHESVGALSNVVEDRRLLAPIRAFAYAMMTDAVRQSGDIARAKQLLEAPVSPLTEFGPIGDVVSAAMRAVFAHDLELHGPAAQALADVNKRLAGLGLGTVPVAILRALERAVRLGAGHRISEQDDPGELFDEVPFLRMCSRMMRVDQLIYRGQYQAAADLAESVRQTAIAHHNPLMLWWALWRWGETMRVLGHAQRVVDEVKPAIDRARDRDHASAWPRLTAVVCEALVDLGQLDEARALACDPGDGLPACAARLAAVRARADILAGGDPKAARAVFERTAPRGDGFARAVRDLALADLDLWCGDLEAALQRARDIETEAGRAGWGFIACRARLVIAEVACRRGDVAAALPPLEAACADAGTHGWVGELAHAHRLAAVIHRTNGDVVAASDTSERLARRLTLADPITHRMRTDSGVRLLTATQAAALRFDTATAIDLTRNRVLIDGRSIDLSRNASQCKLLAALAATPNQPVATETLIPCRKDRGRVLMTISRLRKLLGASTIELGDGSYRLVLPSPWIVLEEVSATAATSAA